MIGEKISPVLIEIEETLWEFEANAGFAPKYSNEGFRAAIKIFVSAVMDKMWLLQKFEEMDREDRLNMVGAAGDDIRSLVKKYTGVDPHDLY